MSGSAAGTATPDPEDGAGGGIFRRIRSRVNGPGGRRGPTLPLWDPATPTPVDAPDGGEPWVEGAADADDLPWELRDEER
ncbi:hypothetical protein [Homoserinibacter sp. YIM 151385]|uniref:hypothetical protein n=1 Tax=Homoserinibacter sp. YIM 151385 TaxID=2985506 RepID=UPI0022F0CB18|nr:hypothetical protein [Homoserinibacter sp. YIM 151385]WBU38414.1 hypothetical protein OF852_02175 [Homoserinibacter sp. YIM 151385]